MVFFNPSSPRYQRGVMLMQYSLMGIAAISVLLTNWGTREHVFSGVSILEYSSYCASHGSFIATKAHDSKN